MSRHLFLVFVSVWLTACGERFAQPAAVMPPEKMEAVLWDLLRADHFVTNYVANRDSSLANHAKGPQLYAAILKKHGITDSTLRISLDYYKNHPKQFYPILDSISQQPALAPTSLANTPVSIPADSTQSPAPAPAPPPQPKSGSDRPNFAPKPLAY